MGHGAEVRPVAPASESTPPGKGAARGSRAAAPAPSNERRYSPSKLLALISALDELGLAPQVGLDGTGLSVEALNDPFALTSTNQFLTAARNAVNACDAPDLGLRVGLRLHVSSYGMYGYALLCSVSLRHAFDTAVRYHQLANGMMQIRWTESEGVAAWHFPALAQMPTPGVDQRLYRFLMDLQFAVHVTLIKDAMGAWCLPARAQFTEPEPDPVYASAHAAALECPVAYGQSENALIYPAAWLARAPQFANPITAAQVSAHCAELLQDFDGQSEMTRRVYQALTRTPGRFPGIEDIAESLCMTSRTLRRRLDAEGTSYSDLLTDVRRALAVDYLSATQFSAEEIASALGFSDAVSFRHAFKRWTGVTPNDFRRERASLRAAKLGA